MTKRLLTDRQFTVLYLTCDGLTVAEMADVIGIRVRSIYQHRDQIKRRLGVRTMSEACALLEHDVPSPTIVPNAREVLLPPQPPRRPSGRTHLVKLAPQPSTVFDRLTDRQGECLRLYCAGHDDDQVAATLGTSRSNARYHRNAILNRLRARSIADVCAMVERPAPTDCIT